MHSRIEIVMPPTSDIPGQVAKIMAPFDENNSGEDAARDQFWDFYVIGGRFAGAKVQARLGEERLNAFHEVLKGHGVTVSGLTCGKQTLQPASQIQMVDALWQEHFPDSGIRACPLFSHSNDQYDSSATLPGDICELKDVPDGLLAERVLIAGPHWDSSEIEARSMYQVDFWNGLDWVKTRWDGRVRSAVEEYVEKIKDYKEDWRERLMPRETWLVVSVDCHS